MFLPPPPAEMRQRRQKDKRSYEIWLSINEIKHNYKDFKNN